MLIMSVIISLPAFSQAIYPVQVYTQLTPPYTPYVPAYYTGTQEKLSVTLVNTDMHQPLLNVYLKMKITSSSFSLITPDEVFTPHIELQAGVPLKLSLTDVAVYFKKENLRVSGGQNEFYRTQLLPDNFYRFNFEVYEVNTNKLLSNPKMGFAQTMIASGEPPVLTMPQKGEIVIEKNIPNIFFSWVPRHMNSIAAAYGTEYEFTMVEIYDKRVAPEAAFEYSRVLYTETTKSTTFVHTAAQPMLQPGLRYAWRVRAVAKEGVNEISVFKNGGYSQVYWFDYTKDCKPVYSTGAIYDRDHIKITWIETEASDYTVEYRKKGASKWYTGSINGNHCSIYNLKLGGEYEYRVGSRCLMNDPYQYSQIKGFRLPAQEERSPNCGLMPDTKLTNRVPARELQKGLPVMVGDFPVFITKVSGSGRFSGEGYVGIPYLQGAQITVTFKDIVVNTDNQLVSGYFETKYDTKTNNRLVDIDQTLTGGKGVGDIRTGEEKAAFKVDYTINPHIKAKVTIQDDGQDDISEEDDYTTLKGLNESYKGHIVIEITDDKGKKQKIVADKIPATIEDAGGKIYEIDEDGNITLISQISDIKLDDKTKNKQRSDIATLSFRASTNTKYSIDEYKDIYAKVTEYYEKYKFEGTNIEASAKFMLPGTSDEVEVYIKDSKKQFVPDSVRFINSSGKEYTSKYNQESRTWLLTTVGSEANDGQELFAVQRLADGSVATLGKLNIFTYQPFERTLNLVSVNGASNHLNAQSVQEELNKIYGKIGITWKVNFLQSGFTYTPANRSTFNVTGSGLFSTLTNDMKAINEAFKKTNIYQEDGLYLFVLPYEPSDKGESMNASGDMPLGSQFGYLFPSADARTIAHEIGHGAFNLEHPFSRPGRNSFKKGDLQNNLMDYTSGTDFAKIQWDATRAPGLVIGLLQNDKDGMFAGKYALSPDFRVIYVPHSNIVYSKKIEGKPFVYGTLPGFIVEDGKGGQKGYLWNGSSYVNENDTTDIYEVQFIDTKSIEKQDQVWLIYDLDKVCNERSYMSVGYSEIALAIYNSDKSKIELDLKSITKKLSFRRKILGCTSLEAKPQDETDKSEWIAIDALNFVYTERICELVYDGKDLYDIENIITTAPGKTLGEVRVHYLESFIRGNKNFSGTEELKTIDVGNPNYIHHELGTYSIFNDDKTVLEELNTKMAYLQASTGIKFYTTFYQLACTTTQGNIDNTAKKMLNKLALGDKGVMCVIAVNNQRNTPDSDKVMVGLAFGSGITAEEMAAITNNIGGSYKIKDFKFSEKLINTYKAIPKRRVVYRYYIKGITPEEKAAYELSIKSERENPTLGGIIAPLTSQVDLAIVNEVSKGQAIDIEYYVYTDNNKNGKKVTLSDNYQVKEQYVKTEAKADDKGSVGYILAMYAAEEYGGWDFTAYKVQVLTPIPPAYYLTDYSTRPSYPFFNYYFSLRPSASSEISDLVADGLFVAGSIVFPEVSIVPLGAITIYYTVKGNNEKALTTLVLGGAFDLAGPLASELKSLGQGVWRFKNNSINNHLVKRELNTALKGFAPDVDMALNKLLDKSLKEAQKYVVKIDDVSAYLVKVSYKDVLIYKVIDKGGKEEYTYIAHKLGYNNPTVKKAVKSGDDIGGQVLSKFIEEVTDNASTLATGKFSQKQISDYLIFATKNPKARKVMLGKYLDGGDASYITRAGQDHTYFDMGIEKWAEAESLVNKNADEMWRINKRFIDEQKALGKEFYFSYEPWIVQSHEYLSKEAEYLIDLGAKDFLKINDNTWKVIW